MDYNLLCSQLKALCLVVVLAVTAVTGATLAYFTDTDSAKNVMTTGNVNITQNEKERNDAGELVDFTDNKPLYPAVGDNNGDGKLDAYDDAEEHLFSTDKNVVDKFVSVTNESSIPVYVRTLIAFELPVAPENYTRDTLKALDGTVYADVVNVAPYLYTVMNEGATAGKGYTLPKETTGEYVIIKVGDVAYLVTEYYYKNESKLDVGESTPACLKQIYLSANATNEDAKLVVGADGNYNILCLSQGVQVEGFNNAKTALDTAFGVVNAANAATWFASVA